MSRKKMLIEVMAPQFAAFDTQLYLDTHPHDKMAMCMFNNYVEEYRKAAAAYEREYGPLDSATAATGEMWAWIDDPWPWEREAN